jgi:hypothetical protein
MKLWLLRLTDEATDIYQYLTTEMVIRAESEQAARMIAQSEGSWFDAAWPMDPIFSTCEMLQAEGEAGVIVDRYLS